MCFYEQKAGLREQPFLIDDRGVTVTYGQLNEFCSCFSKAVEKRKLAFLLCTNTAGSVLGYTACLRHKVVPLLLDVKIDESLFLALTEVYDPDYLYVPDRGADWTTKCAKETETVFYKYGYRMIKRRPKQKTMLYEELALLLTTSGSTGSPKLVRQSYKNITANAKAIAEYLGLHAKERPVTVLPMHYTYGLSVINSHMEAGAAILLTARSLFEKEFWEFFRKEEGTSISGVPFTYEMLWKLGFMDMDLPSLKTMTQAGGKLSLKLHHSFATYAENTGKNFIVMYGQTEATARMSYLPAADSLKKPGSIGIAIPGGTFRLIETEQGRQKEIVEPLTEGELFYEGANVTLGYAKTKEDLLRGDERQGCLATGDIAVRDRDGFYYITGRKKRFLKILGNRVNLDEAEQLLKNRYPNLECACSGRDDQMDIFLAGELKPPEEQIRDFLSGKTKLNPSVFHIYTIPEIPKTSAGKILYGELKESYVHTDDLC